MDAQKIFDNLNEQVVTGLGIRICVNEKVESTNKTVKQMAQAGEKEGLLFVASEQTAGRGRRDHSFFSPANTGLYMSILLQPKVDASDTVFVMPMAAVAVAEAVEEIIGNQKRAHIKWVNDIYVDDKKVCGILVEGVYANESCGETGGAPLLIVGIGINVFEPAGGFPDEIKDRATSVFAASEAEGADAEIIREKLTAAVLNHFYAYYNAYDVEKTMDEYRRRSCVIGRKINVFGNGAEFEATAISIDERGRLIVIDNEGRERVLENDDISIRPV